MHQARPDEQVLHNRHGCLQGCTCGTTGCQVKAGCFTASQGSTDQGLQALPQCCHQLAPLLTLQGHLYACTGQSVWACSVCMCAVCMHVLYACGVCMCCVQVLYACEVGVCCVHVQHTAPCQHRPAGPGMGHPRKSIMIVYCCTSTSDWTGG